MTSIEKYSDRIFENIKPIIMLAKKVRETIKELGGTMPEDLPTPKSSIKEIEQKSQKTITKKKDE